MAFQVKNIERNGIRCCIGGLEQCLQKEKFMTGTTINDKGLRCQTKLNGKYTFSEGSNKKLPVKLGSIWVPSDILEYVII
jgi:hypothetical protein